MKKRTILIIEDNDYLYAGMLRELNHEATMRDINIDVSRAVSVTGAKRKIRELQLSAVSVDMQLPLYDNDTRRMEEDGGALILLFMAGRSKAPQLMYSGNLPNEVRRTLERFGIKSSPPVLHKDPTQGHKLWAKNLLEMAQ